LAVNANSPLMADLIARLATLLKSRGDLRLGVLFGSGATGRLRPDSDLDIAVWPATSRWSDSDDLSLQSALTLAAGREVDLVRLDRIPTLLKWQVARSAVPLFEASPGACARFRAHAAGEYADFAPDFERHAETFRRRLIRRGKAG
jgi:uncharacterized protein